jgi:cobyrinic acid a,c-diamide synthase
MYPRIMIAGTSGDCGKTLVSLGLTAVWRREGIVVAPFKKGPDYIDAAWLTLAAGRSTRNLDSWMMGADSVSASFLAHAVSGGINLIEGNRGLHDGEDAQGTHSSAELAKLLGCPVVLILPAHKITRTAAAIALGMKLLDPALNIAGVVLNRVATARQERIMRAAIEGETGLPVLGAVHRSDLDLLPGRHMGLITPQEHTQAEEAVNTAAHVIRNSLDLGRLRAIAEAAAMHPISGPAGGPSVIAPTADACGLRIGYFKSPAFSFYYPENLEAIDRAGATRVAVDPLENPALPPLDALYIGGGFPETHAARLAGNPSFRRSVEEFVAQGLPVWAECGGLMYLARSIRWKDSSYPMAACLPVEISIAEKPEGHGYEEVVADRPNPFVKIGTRLRGHEFHYSRVIDFGKLNTAFDVSRGVGLGNGRDGIVIHRVLASYLHIHSLASPDWVRWLLNAAMEHKQEKDSRRLQPQKTQ